MLNAFLWGLLATSSLVLGGVIASRFSLSKRAIGIILGFGAGTLISAISYELIFESVKIARGTGFPAFGLFSGAFVFFFADLLIAKAGTANPMDQDELAQSRLIIPMVLAIILDGIPESIVIGLGIFEGGAVSLAMLVAVLIHSSRPEDLTAARAVERVQFLSEVRQAEAAATAQYGWVDQAKGLVRLPVERAMELVVQEWQEPTEARSNMIARIEAATAPPPEPVNPYE